MTEAITHIAEKTQPLQPLPTGLSPELPVLPDIRAVAFDIYGTLIISGSGDIGVTDAEQESGLMKPLLEGLSATNIPDLPARRFRELIEESHRNSRAAGIDYPEVDILEIWRSLADEFQAPAPTESSLELAATSYEVATNPVWPMPGARETLTALRESSRLLGIVSNAQFYTPLLFEAFWNQDAEEVGFDPALCFYSFRSKQAKPGTALYGQLREGLAAKGITPEQTLYVGNDMLKDVHPAGALGFRTALFAGDQRSLRMREDHENLNKPDVVITALDQIPGVLG